MTLHRPSTQKLTDKQIHHAALSSFFNIAEKWQLTRDEERLLLGEPPRSSFFKWRRTKSATLDKNVLERISYIMGIYKALRILLPSEQAANEWPRKPNNAPLFSGRSALDKMLAGNVADLADVRRYLDAERG